MLTSAAFTRGTTHAGAPVARAGESLGAHPGEGVTLSAPCPRDPDDAQRVSDRHQTSGPGSPLSDDNGAGLAPRTTPFAALARRRHGA